MARAFVRQWTTVALPLSAHQPLTDADPLLPCMGCFSDRNTPGEKTLHPGPCRRIERAGTSESERGIVAFGRVQTRVYIRCRADHYIHT